MSHRSSTVVCLEDIASYLGVSLGKVKIAPSFLPFCVVGDCGTTVTGFRNILERLVDKAQSPLLADLNNNRSQVLQWVEYALVYVANAGTSQQMNQLYVELNKVFSTRTFLVDQYLTIADVVLFYFLHRGMGDLSYLDKERFINLSRWFDNLQQMDDLRQHKKTIDFKTNYLTYVAPARH